MELLTATVCKVSRWRRSKLVLVASMVVVRGPRPTCTGADGPGGWERNCSCSCGWVVVCTSCLFAAAPHGVPASQPASQPARPPACQPPSQLILLSLKTGGIGLSLTAANCVLLLPDLACISLSLLRCSCHP